MDFKSSASPDAVPVLTNQPLHPRNTTLPDDFDDSDFESHDDSMRVLTPTSPSYSGMSPDDLPPTYEEAQAQASQTLPPHSGRSTATTRDASVNPNDLQVHRLVLVPNGSESSLQSGPAVSPALTSRQPSQASQPSRPPQAPYHAQLEAVGRAQLSYDSARSQEAGAMDAMLDELLSFTQNPPSTDVDYASYLDRRVAIPPSHQTGSAQFARAYGKTLHAHSISQKEFMSFVDGLNTLLASAPSPGEAQQALLAVADAADGHQLPAAQVLQRFVYRANAHFFAPRGVVAELQTLPTLLHNLSRQKNRGHMVDSKRLRKAVWKAGNAQDVAQALEPYVEPLSWVLPPPDVRAQPVFTVGTPQQQGVTHPLEANGQPSQSLATDLRSLGISDLAGNRDTILTDATLPSYHSVERPQHEPAPSLQPSSAKAAPPLATIAHAEPAALHIPGAYPETAAPAVHASSASPASAGLAGSIASWGEDFGRRMGKWGEDQGRSWGAWGERQGEVWGRWGEEQGRRWGDFGQDVARRVERTVTGEAANPTKGETRDDNRWRGARCRPCGYGRHGILAARGGPLGRRGGPLGPGGLLGQAGLLGPNGPLGPNNLVAQHLQAVQDRRSRRRGLGAAPWQTEPAGEDVNDHSHGRRGRRRGHCGRHRSGRRDPSSDSSSSESESDTDSDSDSDAVAEVEHFEAHETYLRRRDSIEKRFRQDTLSLGEKARESDIEKLHQKRQKDLSKVVQDWSKAETKHDHRRFKHDERAAYRKLRRELKQEKRRVKRECRRGACSKDEARAVNAQYKETLGKAAAEYRQRVRLYCEEGARSRGDSHLNGTDRAFGNGKTTVASDNWMVWLVIQDLEGATE